ncbi:hypothetical protein ES703_114127 [subsurface metagenome]
MPFEKYVNQAFLSVVESAINTLSFSKLETGIAVFEKIAFLISRINYDMALDPANFAASGDSIAYGISTSDQTTNIGLDNSAILDRNSILRYDLGTAASGFYITTPFEKNFADLPGGGLLVPPNPLYIFAKGTALGSVVTVQARLFYTVIKMKVDEYWELVEMRRMIGV